MVTNDMSSRRTLVSYDFSLECQIIVSVCDVQVHGSHYYSAHTFEDIVKDIGAPKDISRMQ
uniref:Uncharacterized protein n=1 Tax=Arion vulgaris TaxID=1028688 RepID=A0A0B7B3S9_9EUPU